MLDYAANGTRYWGDGALAQLFWGTCADAGRDPGSVLEEAVCWKTPIDAAEQAGSLIRRRWTSWRAKPAKWETKTGRCAVHGTVEATRKMPEMGFPFIVLAVSRAIARRRPFRCPNCGKPVTV